MQSILGRSLLAAVAGVVLAFAITWFLSYQEGGVSGFSEISSEPLLPELQANRSGLERMTVTQLNRSLPFARTEEGWGLANRGNYPVIPERIDALLNQLEQLEVTHVSTASEPDYQDYVLRAPEDGGNATRFAFSGSGELPANTLIGRTVSMPDRPRETFTATRRLDQTRVSVVSDSVELDVNFLQWVDQQIMSISRSRLVEVVKEGGDERYRFRRTSDQSFEFVEGAEYESLEDRDINFATGGLANLRFTDVQPRGDVSVGETSWNATYRTQNGVEIALTFRPGPGEELWARIEARTVPAIRQQDGEMVEQDAPGAEAADEVAAINEQVSDWTYRLSQAVQEQVLSPLPVISISPG